jgi:uncharacterized protein YjiS (DUF1127 family)
MQQYIVHRNKSIPMFVFRVRWNPEKRKKGAEMLTSFIRLVREWRQYGEAVRELAALNDRELADIGITRSDILRVARQHEED